MRLRSTAVLGLALAVAPALPAQVHQHAPAPGEKLGKVTFPTSCNAEAQQRFERAVAMLHSFWFDEAEKAFTGVAEADPACAMAPWGIAMTMLGNPMTRAAPPRPVLEKGAAALAQAQQLAGKASHREQLWIAAAEAMYRDWQTVDHLTRMQAHEQAFQALRAAHPEDVEVSIFYARTLVANSPPSDLTFAKNKQAAAILEPLFKRHPDHPGLAHYLIHAYDAPPIAKHGLDAARRYVSIAPTAPHALHMPSHIFTRVGAWDESIETNRRSAEAEGAAHAPHPMDYMVYAYLQQGRDAEAKKIVEQAVVLPDRFYGGIIGYNAAAMPARFALERNRWEDAAGLALPAGTPLPQVEALTRFARAVGAARTGQVELARLEVAALAGLEVQLKQANDRDWAVRVGAQRLAAAAWLAHAEGNHAEALRLGREAADLEDTVEKHPVTPGPLLPARELYGDLLIVHKQPKEALAAYDKVLEREPNRARAIYGAAQAAEAAGDPATARARYAELAKLMDRADPTRAEAQKAKSYLKASPKRSS